jgi:hypothetical protein
VSLKQPLTHEIKIDEKCEQKTNLHSWEVQQINNIIQTLKQQKKGNK